MLYIDIKYTNMIAPKLRNFKHTEEYKWNFSCPFCGDSSKKKWRARGYIFRAKIGLFVYCHNCNVSTNLGNLIKHLDPILYKEYVLENYKESGAPRSSHKAVADAVPNIFFETKVLDAAMTSLKRISDMPKDHPAVQYILNRKIPEQYFDLLRYAPKFTQYVNHVIPNKLKVPEKDHPRLIIPFLNKQGKCFAFQGRAFGNEDPKYMTIKLDENEEKIFGMDRLDDSKRVYIVEGPLDSLFLPNAIAVSGSSFNSPTIEKLKSNATIVYDNEPRSKQLTKLIDKTIEDGYSVCLWPETVNGKDVNEMIQNGLTQEEIVRIIDENTVKGPLAQLRFASWKRC